MQSLVYLLRGRTGTKLEVLGSMNNTSLFTLLWFLGRTTSDFRTDDASGSTSQAANIVQALELQAKLLLIDEDTTATNFMIRDARMQASLRPHPARFKRSYKSFDENAKQTSHLGGPDPQKC